MSKARTRLMHQADAAFSQVVKWRDGHTCERCESDYQPECAHLITRDYKAVRTSLQNAVTLCRTCHAWFTHHPVEWENWLEDKWPGRLQQVKTRALKYERVDWQQERDQLRELLAQYEA